MKSLKLTEKLRNKVKPFLQLPEIGLSFYHPQFLPEKINIEIAESRLYSNYVIDQLRKLEDALDKLSEASDINEDNWKQRKDLYSKIREKQNDAG